ncbi:DUF3551 domain-containing protein [Bradyrhizobium yuanmingense]|uniref:DUF3551 domain-containing protein n=1 Tax=Bradyrhizobium yuanmingense TaxID=108015 RepID=UPI0023B9CAD6|nr:DUF3551 domain-containing protein [Bradyrhizobium yuanmingense]MDF0494520.1 DUF3551 domain-containing protein [Bradyrhizobium yuanmingense]
MTISTSWGRMLSVLAVTSMVAGVTAVFAPAAAEPFNPNYPVCLQQWEWGGSNRIYCSYRSWEDCKASAMGLPAMCLANPYWSQPTSARPVRPPHGRSAPDRMW